MDTRSAEHQEKPPVSPGQWDELSTLHLSSLDEDEEGEAGVYGFFCPRSSKCSPEDEPDCGLIHDNSVPFLWGSFLRRTGRHWPRFFSLTESPAGYSRDATGKNKLFVSSELLAFDEHSQTKPGHVLGNGKTDPEGLLRADLGGDHNTLDWEEDEVNAFSLSPGEVKMCPGQLCLLTPALCPLDLSAHALSPLSFGVLCSRGAHKISLALVGFGSNHGPLRMSQEGVLATRVLERDSRAQKAKLGTGGLTETLDPCSRAERLEPLWDLTVGTQSRATMSLPCVPSFTFLEDKKDAEIEAKKACDWLRAAGFPQYAQLYEDSLFPLDISAVKKDHSFLDQDSLKSLCRRLMTLNTCASMKLDVHFQHKQNEDSEEEDLCAISNRWAFQRDSKRWSRVGSADVLSQGSEALSCSMRPVSSRESVLTDLSTNPEAASLHSTGSVGSAGGTLSYRTNRPLGAAGTKEGSDLNCSGVSLEDFDPAATASSTWAAASACQRRRARRGDCLVYIPCDHKPGTFPKSLSIESLCPLGGSSLTHWDPGSVAAGLGAGGRGGSSSSTEGSSSPRGFARRRRGSCSSLGSRVSIYDNVPDFGSSEDFCKDGEVTYENLDDILQHMWGLQQKVELWCKAIAPSLDGEEGGEEEEDEEELDSGGEPSNLHFEERSMSDVGTSASDFDSTGNSLNEAEEIETRERRDSGVGASLTRPCRKLRWHSFQNSHRPSLNSASLEINRQSSAQLNLLQKCSLLRLTAIMEKYSVPHKQAWTWTVPKFMKRSKVPDYRDKVVFGVPPIVNVQRTGQPLPQSIQQAMRYLRSQCLDQVGIFRKSGVKSRIQALRHMNESSPDNVSYAGQSAYDVADLLKQYFRDLPEPIFTSKLTDTFLQIYQFVSKEQRLQAVQAAIILMPDENREVLQTLLYFLSDIASAEENQMTAGNLAVCLAPSIFHLNVSKKESTSPRAIHKRGTMGKPDQKDLNENMAATQGLSHMITDCKKLFQVSHDILLQLSSSYMAADAYPHPLTDLVCQGESKDLHSYFEQSIQNLLKESSEKFKGWLSTPGPLNTELSCKKVGDGNPLRLWKVSTDVEAPPAAVLHRVLRERHLWDEDLLQSKVVEALDQDMEVYHYVTDSMAPHPRRDCMVLRRWRTDLPRGACLLMALSVEHDKVPVEGGVKAVVLTSQYLIEPSAMGRSRVTHICRADLRGRSPEWYNRVFGHLCAMELARIRDSFPALSPSGPETKI
ncbi:StAR related lipid transfer domain containing 8 [Pitangus sulphuratus]|nr:StAR related lipid transfer domain containing 8 [Pitangus sulphuratus]